MLSKDINTALSVLNTQMVNNNLTIQQPTVSVAAAANVGTPNGNPTIVGSVINRFGGTSLVYAETVTLTCTRDAQTGGATLGQESFTITGQSAVTDTTSYLWPAGSGATGYSNCVDPGVSNSGGNLTYNGTFSTVTTTNYPDNWVYLTGVATTNFVSVSSPIFGSTTKSLQMLGDGATLLSFCQPLNTAASTSAGGGGSPATLKPSTVYQGNLMYKLQTASPTNHCRLTVDLIDGSNAVINNGASTANSTYVDLETIADTNWHALPFSFQTPAVLPAAYKLRIHFTNAALDNSNSVYISSVGLTAPTALYTFGPYFSLFRGSTQNIVNDAFTVAVSNDWTVNTVSQWTMRIFGTALRTLGYQLPMKTSSPTVPDSVVG